MKIENNKFLDLVEGAMREPGRVHMRPVIEKELLHYDILFALKEKIQDYKIGDYPQKLDKMIERLSSIIHGEKFREQMIRFLPMDVQERTLLNKNYLYLLLQEIGLILETLGLEWKEKNGDIYCTNFLRKLSVTHFPEVLIQMLKVRDKYGIVVAESQELIVSSENKLIAKELSTGFNSFLPKGYKVDDSLQAGEWYIKFTKRIG